MQVRVLYFGVLKELMKRDGEQMDVPPDFSVGALIETVRLEQDGSAAVWRSLAVAVNREYADTGRALHEGDEVALLPPVSGGADNSSRVSVGREERWEEIYVPLIAKDRGAINGEPVRDRGNRRSSESAAQDKTVRSFAQDDTPVSIGGRRSDAD